MDHRSAYTDSSTQTRTDCSANRIGRAQVDRRRDRVRARLLRWEVRNLSLRRGLSEIVACDRNVNCPPRCPSTRSIRRHRSSPDADRMERAARGGNLDRNRGVNTFKSAPAGPPRRSTGPTSPRPRYDGRVGCRRTRTAPSRTCCSQTHLVGRRRAPGSPAACPYGEEWTSQSPVGSTVCEIAGESRTRFEVGADEVSQSQLTSVASQRPWRLS
jgi:hypothetical protein